MIEEVTYMMRMNTGVRLTSDEQLQDNFVIRMVREQVRAELQPSLSMKGCVPCVSHTSGDILPNIEYKIGI